MKRINLLPKLKQREIAHERVFYSVSVAIVIAVAILLLGILVQVGAWMYLDRTGRSVEAEIEELKRVANKTENAEIKRQIREMNAEIEDFDKLSLQTPQWSTVFAAFLKNVPTGVKITQFEAKTETKEITISGYSPTRDLVIDLYNSINADKENFKDINYPLENVTQPTNVRFNFTFFIADGVLVNGAKK